MPPPSAALASATKTYRIEDGSLSLVLGRFAGASRVALSLVTSLTDGRSSPGIEVTFTVHTASESLLAGSGLEAGYGGQGEFTMQPVSLALSSV